LSKGLVVVSPFQAPLLMSCYDKAMESFVRLAHFDASRALEFECETENFDGPLAHDDLIQLALMLRKIIEICGVVNLAKKESVDCGGSSVSVYRLISRIIHSVELESFTRAIFLDLRERKITVVGAIEKYPEHFMKTKGQPTRKEPPVVRVGTEHDGITTFLLSDFLKKVDAIVCAAAEEAANDRIFIERAIRN